MKGHLNRSWAIFLAISTLCFFIGCSDGDKPIIPKSRTKVVYLAGNEKSEDGTPIAAYWKDGIKVPLSAPAISDAYRVTVSNGDVYVAGYINGSLAINNGIFSNTQAVYWKNGTITTLTNAETPHAVAKDIVVSGNDVYVAGFTNEVDVSHKAVYWKNGEIIELSTGSPIAEADAIFVKDGNVFVGGYHGGAAYWKNGTIVQLHEDITTVSGVSSIFIDGKDIYALGSLDGDIVYWKNDSVVYVVGEGSGKLHAQVATGIFVVNGKVYVSGYIERNGVITAAYWENNMERLLSGYVGTSIMVVETSVYVSGYTLDGQGGHIPTYWSSGAATIIVSISAEANSVFVDWIEQ
jgi:hypothetical protein